MESKEPEVVCVVLGDHNVGKTSLIKYYLTESFEETLSPSLYDNYRFEVEAKSITITVEVIDTPGLQTYDSIRELSYDRASVCLLCFSVTNPSSFQSIEDKWHREIKSHAANLPIILVGTKYDKLEEGSKEGLVYEQKADSLREKLGYSKYLHCSAKDGTNVKRVFDSAIRAALKDKMSLMTGKGKKKDCVVY